MSTQLITQSDGAPSAISLALRRCATPSVTRIRIAVAYTTGPGYDLLKLILRQAIGPDAWDAADKDLITSFDFYITEPRALRSAQADGFTVARGLARGNRAFHPKLYSLEGPFGARMIVGSANLTEPALTDNVEMACLRRVRAGSSELQDLRRAWKQLQDSAVPLSSADIAKYDTDRSRNAPRSRPSPRKPRKHGAKRATMPQSAAGLPTFPVEVEEKRLDPAIFKRLWVEAGAMSSSESHNQLELPRYANHFFGFSFVRHAAVVRRHVIGHITLDLRGQRHHSCDVQWRGAPKMNKMERLYLPTVNKGGVPYRDMAILFERRRGAFLLTIAPWGGALAASWRRASSSSGHLYKLGHGSTRQCGFL